MGPSSFFGFMRDHKLEDEQLATRCTILRCVGSAAFKGQDLKSKVSWTCYFTIFTYSRSLCGTIQTSDPSFLQYSYEQQCGLSQGLISILSKVGPQSRLSALKFKFSLHIWQYFFTYLIFKLIQPFLTRNDYGPSLDLQFPTVKSTLLSLTMLY